MDNPEQAWLAFERLHRPSMHWVAEDGDHLIWHGPTMANGQPYVLVNKHYRGIRTWLWKRMHGNLPSSRAVMPQCGIERCIAPECMRAFLRRELKQKPLALILETLKDRPDSMPEYMARRLTTRAAYKAGYAAGQRELAPLIARLRARVGE